MTSQVIDALSRSPQNPLEGSDVVVTDAEDRIAGVDGFLDVVPG